MLFHYFLPLNIIVIAITWIYGEHFQGELKSKMKSIVITLTKEIVQMLYMIWKYTKNMSFL